MKVLKCKFSEPGHFGVWGFGDSLPQSNFKGAACWARWGCDCREQGPDLRMGSLRVERQLWSETLSLTVTLRLSVNHRASPTGEGLEGGWCFCAGAGKLGAHSVL